MACTRLRPSPRAEVPRRHTHTSSTHTYLKMWRGSKIDYQQSMDQATTMNNMPKLVDRIIRVEATMKRRGLVPFVHAMPAGAKVPMHFFGKKERYFRCLRPCDIPFMVEWKDAVMELYQNQTKSHKPHILSLSYALTSGIKPLESAASWGFQNHLGNLQNGPLSEIYEKAINKCAPAHPEYFLEFGKALIRKYGRLRVGDFLLIGVPQERLARWCFDSKPYNIPTGSDIRSVVENPARYTAALLQEGTHMASMIICNETLTPDSGLVMVMANNAEEVDAFCAKESLTPTGEVDLYREIMTPSAANFEDEEDKARARVDADFETLCQEFSGKLKLKNSTLSAELLDLQASDFPSLAF